LNLYSALYISKELRYGPCVTMVSHSFTCHPHTNHTCLYSPAARHHRPAAGTYCAYPQRDGQAELTLVAGYVPRLVLDMVTHPSTNRTRHRLTLLDRDQHTTATLDRHSQSSYRLPYLKSFVAVDSITSCNSGQCLLEVDYKQ